MVKCLMECMESPTSLFQQQERTFSYTEINWIWHCKGSKRCKRFNAYFSKFAYTVRNVSKYVISFDIKVVV